MTKPCCCDPCCCCGVQGCVRTIGILCLVLSSIEFLAFFVAVAAKTFAEAGFLVHNIIAMLCFGAAIGFNIVLIVAAGIKNRMCCLVWFYGTIVVQTFLFGLLIHAVVASVRYINNTKSEADKDDMKLNLAWEFILQAGYFGVMMYFLWVVYMWQLDLKANQIGQNPDDAENAEGDIKNDDLQGSEEDDDDDEELRSLTLTPNPGSNEALSEVDSTH